MSHLSFEFERLVINDTEMCDADRLSSQSLAEILRIEYKLLGYKVDPFSKEVKQGWGFAIHYPNGRYKIRTRAVTNAEIPVAKDSTGPTTKYCVRFDKKRTCGEIALRRNKLTKEDPIVELTEAILKFKLPDVTDYSRKI